MSDRHDAILLFGPPGAGKGTQGTVLGATPGFYHLSTGDMFRGLDRDTELGQEIVGYMSAGELVPDALTVRLFSEHLDILATSGAYRPGKDLLILDGIPRSLEQATLIDNAVDVLAVIRLVAKDENALVERLRGRALKENRPDDAKEEVVRRRLEVYAAETRPVLGHYDASRIHEIDAIGLPSRVLLRVLEAVVPIQESRV
ncbi:MAG: adenylate kinase [Phycisphaerae bacterium]|nr:adenylate kinase [Phycisphaerae bacterium]